MLTYSSIFTAASAIQAKAQAQSLVHSVQEEPTGRRGWIRSFFTWIYLSLCKAIAEESLYSQPARLDKREKKLCKGTWKSLILITEILK